MRFAVCVQFRIKPDAWDRFLPLMEENAKNSLAKEEGCLHFDVCSDAERPFEVFLYEIYASPEAFSEHLASDHFRQFDKDVEAMIAEKKVQTYRTVT